MISSTSPYTSGPVLRPADSSRSGWGGIRTPGGLSPSAVFKTAAIVHSATHPEEFLACFGQLYLPEWEAVKRTSGRSGYRPRPDLPAVSIPHVDLPPGVW